MTPPAMLLVQEWRFEILKTQAVRGLFEMLKIYYLCKVVFVSSFQEFQTATLFNPMVKERVAGVPKTLTVNGFFKLLIATYPSEGVCESGS